MKLGEKLQSNLTREKNKLKTRVYVSDKNKNVFLSSGKLKKISEDIIKSKCIKENENKKSTNDCVSHLYDKVEGNEDYVYYEIDLEANINTIKNIIKSEKNINDNLQDDMINRYIIDNCKDSTFNTIKNCILEYKPPTPQPVKKNYNIEKVKKLLVDDFDYKYYAQGKEYILNVKIPEPKIDNDLISKHCDRTGLTITNDEDCFKSYKTAVINDITANNLLLNNKVENKNTLKPLIVNTFPKLENVIEKSIDDCINGKSYIETINCFSEKSNSIN